jgi:4-amino-4-deoxy-L-arabinose transferase-like glycosyltransferase
MDIMEGIRGSDRSAVQRAAAGDRQARPGALPDVGQAVTGRLPAWLRGTAGVLLLAVLWLAATAWLRPLMLPDEGRYVGVAWEMMRSGDWLVPTLNGLPYFHKPPLFYWITAASLSTFGLHEWAARLAPLLGATAAASALYLFALRWAGAALARLSLLVLVTQPILFAGAQFANLDMLVAGCIAATVLALASAALSIEEGQRPRGTLAAGYAFAALGLLAKGLIGVVLPGMILVAWLLARRRPRTLLALVWWPGLVLFAVVGAPWFIAMQQRFPAFLDYFFVVQHFKRFTTTGFNNPQPFWFYLAVLPLTTLPWSAWLGAAARPAYWRDPERGSVRGLMWLWLVLVTLFFSLPKSKLIGYILPATVPLAFLVADAIAIGWRAGTGRSRRWIAASAIGGALVCVGVVVAVAVTRDNALGPLGHTLAQRVTPRDQVVFLHGYYFDLPFYARLHAPVHVVDDWTDPELSSRDDWHKELLDAQHFEPVATPPVLLTPARVGELLCTGRTTWFVGAASMPARYPVLAAATLVTRQGDTALWRLPAGALSAAQCREMPSANSAGM